MKRRLLRGGSYLDYAWDLRATSRNWHVPEVRYWSVGFRIVVVRGKP
mgnify:CR=1 FL=1